MPMNDLQRAVLETTATRDQAEALLEGLQRAKDECDAVRKREGRQDLMAQVRGCSSLDEAIDSTKRMIAALERAVQQGRERLRARGEETPVDSGSVILQGGADAAPTNGRALTASRQR
ncbi:MAG: hypothetical protein ACF8QF_13985 [Phycisphaerales bacterium]